MNNNYYLEIVGKMRKKNYETKMQYNIGKYPYKYSYNSQLMWSQTRNKKQTITSKTDH